MSKARELAELGAVYDSGALSNRNVIINGAIQVYQRGSQALSQGTSVFGPDGFRFSPANLDNLAGTITQDSDSPDGFGNSLKLTVTTAESAIASDEYAYITQLVEAQNLQQLAYGTSAAKQVTVSFYVKSSVTGTFALGLYKPDNTAQIHNLTYTIDAANTWEYKTLTFAANTLSGGAIDDDTGVGLYVTWHLAAGSGFKGGGSTSGWTSYSSSKWADGQATDAVITTTNATFQLTGCQLEVGTEATPFEHRSFGDEVLRCYRYFYKADKSGYIPGRGNGSTAITDLRLPTPVPLRAQPSFDATGTSYAIDSDSYVSASNVGFTFSSLSNNSLVGQITGLSGMTDNRMAIVSLNAGYSLDAEL